MAFRFSLLTMFYLLACIAIAAGSASENNEPSLIALFVDSCESTTELSIPTENGAINVRCPRTSNEVDAMLFDLVNRELIPPSSFSIARTRVMADLDEHSVAPTCVLSCDRGRPSRRNSPSASSVITEFAAISFGCEDFENLHCRDNCPLSIYDVENGTVTCTSNTSEGSVCRVQCNDGHFSSGALTKRCDENSFRWTPETPFICNVPTCPPLPEVRNGRLTCSKENKFLSHCHLECNSGFYPGRIKEQWCFPWEGSGVSWGVLNQGAVERSSGGLEMSCEDLSPDTQCNLDPLHREPCGGENIDEKYCLLRACCWDANENRCYLSKEGLRLQNLTISPFIRITTRHPNHIRRLFNTYNETNQRKLLIYLAHRLGQRSKKRPHACGCNTPHLGIYLGDQCLPPTSSPPASAQLLRNQTRAKSLKFSDPRQPKVRVFGGASAYPETWPWQAIVYFNEMLCGGTLVRDDLVLTAGHCVTGSDGSVLRSGTITLGARNLSNFLTVNGPRDPHVQQRLAELVIRHHNFSMLGNGVIQYDIAMIKFSRTVDITGTFIRSICIPASPVPIPKSCHISGFGIKSNINPFTTLLQTACVPTQRLSVCQPYFHNGLTRNMHLCAGKTDILAPDICQGDSGGPLVCQIDRDTGSDCGWYLAGISSFGNIPCGSASPSVYTHVPYFTRWIVALSRRL